jgi:hypothetical protein
MNCLSLNCRGARNDATINEVDVLVKTYIPKMVFLCETRKKSKQMARYKGRLGLRGFAGFDSDGMSGGLALCWLESLQVEVKDANARFIDVLVWESVSSP